MNVVEMLNDVMLNWFDVLMMMVNIFVDLVNDNEMMWYIDVKNDEMMMMNVHDEIDDMMLMVNVHDEMMLDVEMVDVVMNLFFA